MAQVGSGCAITALSAGTQSACNATTNTYSQQVTITYSNAPTGTINVNGQTFAVTSSPQTVTLTNLSANGSAVNVTAFFTNSTSCTFTQNNLFTAPAACNVAACSITAISAGTQTACNASTNTYTQQITITYSNAPTGTINVNGQTFTVTSSPQTVTLTNLPANGNAVNVTAFFTSNTSCTFTQNSAFTAPASCATTCSAGDVAASLDGTTVNYCPGTVLDLLTDSTENILAGEDYYWVFMNATDTLFIATGGSYSGDINAALVGGGGTPIPFGTYLVFGVTTDNGQTTICATTPGDFTVNVLQSTDPACAGTQCDAGDVAASLNGTTVNYCPGTSIDLLTDGTEVIPTGEDYFWVFINTTDTVLVPTNGSYSGDVNAYLVGLGGTAIPTGTYLVYGLVTSGGGMAACDFTAGDFTVNVLASNDPLCAPCSINSITVGTTSACNPSNNSYTQQVIVNYSNAPSGTLNINGQTFTVTTSPQTITLTNLPANGNAVNLSAAFTNNTSCSYTQTGAWTAPASCQVNPCSIDSLIVGNQTACNPSTNTYTQSITIYYQNSPGGTINVNGQTFTSTTSPQTVTLSNLTANGNAVNVNAFFTANTACSFNQNALFTAPVSCTPPACSAGDVAPSLIGTTVNYCPGTSIDLLTDGTENILTGEFYLWVFINATDTVFINTGGDYTGDINADLVAGGASAIPFGTYTVFALTTSGGGAAICDITPGDFTVNVLQASDPLCSSTPTCSAGDVASSLNGATFNYCPGSTVSLVTDGSENILTGEDYYWVFLNATDTVFINTGGNYTGDINADLVAGGATAIPFGSYVVFGLTTSGGGTAICDVTPGDFTVNVLQANDPLCTSPCSIVGLTAGIPSACNPASNTYSVAVTLTYSNSPGGNINVNGQLFATTSSPQTVTLVGLTANGAPVNVSAFFVNNASCSFTANALFTAPPSCAAAACNLSVASIGNQSACDSVSNTYTQNVTLSYTNSPGGILYVNGQSFTATSSPQMVTLTGLTANGLAVNVFAVFANDSSCSASLSNAFIAPVSCSPTPPNDTLVVMMYPNGVGTLFVGNDVITSTPFTGYYPVNQMLDIQATVNGSNSFDFWRLNNQTLIDYNPSTSFLFINQDTLFAYFNGYVSVSDLLNDYEYFTLYPTIIQNQITVDLKANKESDLTIDLYGVDGKFIQNIFQDKILEGTRLKETYFINNISSGMYFLRISNSESAIIQKIIKE